MAGTPNDWSDWYAAGGRRLTDLAADTPRVRAARLHARALELAARLPNEAVEAWLAMGETLADRVTERQTAGFAGHA
jgi:hypothetical protein